MLRRRHGELVQEILKAVAENGELSIYEIAKIVTADRSDDRPNTGRVQNTIKKMVEDKLLEYNYVRRENRLAKLHRLTPLGFITVLGRYVIPRRANATLAKIIKMNPHLFPVLSKAIDSLHPESFTSEVIKVLSDGLSLLAIRNLAILPFQSFEHKFVTFLANKSEKINRAMRKIPELWKHLIEYAKDDVVGFNSLALYSWFQYAERRLQEAKDPRLEWAIKLNQEELKKKGWV